MTKRSPIKQKPLRSPGQSLMTGLLDPFLDRCMLPIMIASCLLGMAVYAWVVELFWVESPPLLVTFAAVVAIVVAWIRGGQVSRRIDNDILGIHGEQRVGEVLDDLKPDGYRIFHDIQGGKFNIDHVVVGPTGVFVIETKTRSKPVGRDAQIEYNGKRVLVDGIEPDRDPIEQVKRNAKDVRAMVEGIDLAPPIRPVVVFPGWWTNEEQSHNRDVWVLNELRVIGWIRKEPVRLNSDEIIRIATVLEDTSRRGTA